MSFLSRLLIGDNDFKLSEDELQIQSRLFREATVRHLKEHLKDCKLSFGTLDLDTMEHTPDGEK